jgi:hypothetical protein
MPNKITHLTNQHQINNPTTRHKISEVPLSLSFNEYLRLVVGKVLPPSQAVRVSRRRALIVGEPSECEALLEEIKQQLRRYSVKVLVPSRTRTTAELGEAERQLNK